MERKDKKIVTGVKKSTTVAKKPEDKKSVAPKVENKVTEVKKPIPDPVEVKKEDVIKEEKVEVKNEEVDERNLRKGTKIQLRYKKIGGGPLRLCNPKRIIKPGQVFTAYPSDIPKAFADLVQCLDDEEVQKLVIEEKPFHVKEELYTIGELTPGGWHVLNGKTKKPLQDKPMSKEDAIILRDSLNS